jgi:hypothetical protein
MKMATTIRASQIPIAENTQDFDEYELSSQDFVQPSITFIRGEDEMIPLKRSEKPGKLPSLPTKESSSSGLRLAILKPLSRVSDSVLLSH